MSELDDVDEMWSDVHCTLIYLMKDYRRMLNTKQHVRDNVEKAVLHQRITQLLKHLNSIQNTITKNMFA